MKAIFSVPVDGTLTVVLNNGDQWEAQPQDLAKFALVETRTVYKRIDEALDLAAKDNDIPNLNQTVFHSVKRLVADALIVVGDPDSEANQAKRVESARTIIKNISDLLAKEIADDRKERTGTESVSRG